MIFTILIYFVVILWGACKLRAKMDVLHRVSIRQICIPWNLFFSQKSASTISTLICLVTYVRHRREIIFISKTALYLSCWYNLYKKSLVVAPKVGGKHKWMHRAPWKYGNSGSWNDTNCERQNVCHSDGADCLDTVEAIACINICHTQYLCTTPSLPLFGLCL